jgi:hypothetical protein
MHRGFTGQVSCWHDLLLRIAAMLTAAFASSKDAAGLNRKLLRLCDRKEI